MSAFDLKIWNKHILIDLNNSTLIIDTGSSKSFHQDKVIVIDDCRFDVSQSFMGVDGQYLSDKIDCEISGLVGMDIMSNFAVHFDARQFGNFIGFFDKSDVCGSPIDGASNLAGLPSFTLGVNHKRAVFLFDTAAPISYISSKFVHGLIPCSKTWDFSPLMQGERYEVDLYYLDSYISSRLNSLSFNCFYALMPTGLEAILAPLHIDGIIGFDLIDKFRLVLSENITYLAPQGI